MKSIVSKPWGTYQVLEESKNYLIKKIIVNPGGKLSLQSHSHRSEHWIVVKGIAEVTINEKIKVLKANQNIFIPLKCQHRMANKEKLPLIVIEVWYGDILDENDIIRYEDIYNRNYS